MLRLGVPVCGAFGCRCGARPVTPYSCTLRHPTGNLVPSDDIVRVVRAIPRLAICSPSIPFL